MGRVKVGFGCDTHRLKTVNYSHSIRLCGVPIATNHMIEAHSDGDVGLHALVDAMLGSCALGDIGEHFPDSDPIYKGRKSGFFVEHALGLLHREGAVISNVDITIISQVIKLKSFKDDMRCSVGRILGLETDYVNIKAKTAENMGALGRGEGLGAYAVVCVTCP